MMRNFIVGAAAMALLGAAITISPAQAADMTGFNKSCGSSESLKAMFATKAGDHAQADMDALCKCTADAFAPKATQDQIDLLAANVAGKMTAAQKDAYNNDDATQEMAMDAMNACLESTGVAKDYGG